MAQAAFPFEAPVTSRRTMVRCVGHRVTQVAPVDPIAYDIGWDHARHLLAPPIAHLHADSPVRLGWQAGRAAFARRTLKATPQVRAWLQLRLSAWVSGRIFEDVQVTPHHLAQIETTHCPVTRARLTRGTGTGSDTSVTTINPRAGVAAGNIATLSSQANQAKAQLDWCEAMAQASRIGEAGSDGRVEVDDLDADQWARLGVLMSFVTPLPHATAAMLPLRVLPPNRLRVLNPVQALQVMLTLQFTQAGYARRLVALAALMPGSEVRQAFQVFMHTLLARRLDAGHALEGVAMRRAMEDTWANPLVNRRWQRLALRLTEAQCEQLLQRAVERGLSGRDAQWMSADQATEGWALESGGYIQWPSADTGRLAEAATAPTPGKLRNRGSQKLANCEAFTATGAFQ